ncbi:MAG TPA: LuxR C-terminal-related transcriptional regulator [Candidatus Dormibacteraeota bacterium]|nr:LuxR C-terminal-related transcriptional regulator [Candidatus Dormibacteraeota bacterium]
MKLIRRSVATHPITQSKLAPSPFVYLFCEKSSGTAHFQVEAGPAGELPIDHAAGLLAMHCLVRGQSPSDYVIMVPAPQECLGALEEKAEELLQAGHKVKSAVRLTRREQEVLDGILRSLANKEIASELNLSERTVKFHVSSLLAKFKVRGRMELMRETSRSPMQPLPAAVTTPAPQMPTFVRRSNLYAKPMHSHKVLPLARPRLMA